MNHPPAANDEDAPGAEARRWVVRLASGDTSAEELAAFEAWRGADAAHGAAFARERRGWQDLALIEDAFDAPLPARARRRWMLATGLAAAAALAGVVALPSVLLRIEADHRSGHGAITSVTLADGSRAVIDSDSAIAVDFDGEERRVRLLAGRAWFEVRHGDPRPFRVAARGGVTQDIGTAFEVDRTGAAVRIGVSEGAVRVAGATGEAITLRAGEKAQYAPGGDASRIAGAGTGMIANWRNGELLLRNAPLAAAIAEIARYRAAPVFVWGDLSRAAPVSGSFRTDHAEDALATLVTMRGLAQLRLPGGIVVLRLPAAR